MTWWRGGTSIAAAIVFVVFSSLRISLPQFDEDSSSSVCQPTHRSVQDQLPLKENIPIFYNLFIKSKTDIDWVTGLVGEQLELMDPAYHRTIYVSSIGELPPCMTAVTTATVKVLQHGKKGSELETLTNLWDYCQANPNDKVVYLHSKGSFHPSEQNNLLRQFLTKGALSSECSNLPETCNVCSARMSPLPHPHTPGNMWLARCSYVRDLLAPEQFQIAMGFPENPCVGSGRFSAEHWVHSHPSVRPCDLFAQPSYVWGYGGIPSLETFEDALELALAPRFPVENYFLEDCVGHGTLDHRLKEYRRVYDAKPADSWWGWEFLASVEPCRPQWRCKAADYGRSLLRFLDELLP